MLRNVIKAINANGSTYCYSIGKGLCLYIDILKGISQDILKDNVFMSYFKKNSIFGNNF
jgi:hypothetical protein